MKICVVSGGMSFLALFEWFYEWAIHCNMRETDLSQKGSKKTLSSSTQKAKFCFLKQSYQLYHALSALRIFEATCPGLLS